MLYKFSIIQSHAGCIEKVDDECDFGPLRDIMLPSFCVSLPRMNIPIEHVIGVTKRPRGELFYSFLTNYLNKSF